MAWFKRKRGAEDAAGQTAGGDTRPGTHGGTDLVGGTLATGSTGTVTYDATFDDSGAGYATSVKDVLFSSWVTNSVKESLTSKQYPAQFMHLPGGATRAIDEADVPDLSRLPRVVEGPVVGYRLWTVNVKSGIVTGQNERRWEPTMPAAKHATEVGKERKHAAPAWNCRCGYHALSDVYGALEYSGVCQGYGFSVVGVVCGWGKVILHETGWRSEYAKPLGIIEGHVPFADIEGYRELFSQIVDEQARLRVASKVAARTLEVPVFSVEQARVYVSEFTKVEAQPR